MLSVVIPTHNRSESVIKVVKRLDEQRCSEQFEIICVLDGCSDDTRERLQSMELVSPLRLLETPGLGAAAARNRGASAASGDLLLFIDDDIIPQEGMLQAHIDRHSSAGRLVVIGPYPYAPDMQVNAVDFYIRDWWHTLFRSLADPTHKFTYRDCLTGNISLRKADFFEVGGFDEAFQNAGREDYELGIRLLKAGVQFSYAPEALTYHYPVSNLGSLVKKTYINGQADVYLALKHPEVYETLPLRRYVSHLNLSKGIMRRLALTSIMKPQLAVSLLSRCLDSNSNRLWDWRLQRVYRYCMAYAYLLGVVSAVGGYRKLNAFLSQWQEPADSPGKKVRIEDVDLLSGVKEIGELENCDRLLVIPRMGDLVLGWMELPFDGGQESLPASDLVKAVSERFFWPAWCVSNDLRCDSRVPGTVDQEAWREFQHKMTALDDVGLANRTESVKRCSFSAVIFVESNSGCPSPLPSGLTPGQVVCVSADGGSLAGRLKAALPHCPGDFVALLKDTDKLDPGFEGRVLDDFSDHSLSCVIAPVISKKVSSRGDELYNVMAGFDRTIAWNYCYLNDWLHPVRILYEFNPSCYRVIVSKKALLSAIDAIDYTTTCYEDLVVAIIHEMLRAYESIAFEPRALIWHDTSYTPDDVLSMARKHSFRTTKDIALKLRTAKTGRLRDLKILSKQSRILIRRTIRSVRSHSEWPFTYALSEVWASFAGFWRGLSAKPGITQAAEYKVEEVQGIKWVLLHPPVK